MAIAFVQQATGTGTASTTATATLGSNPTSGNTLVAEIASSAGDVSGVSGGGVTTWTKLKGPGNVSSAWVNIYYGVVDTTPATGVTATATSGNIALNVSEWSGIKTSGAADASSDQDQGPSTTPTTGPITASAGPALYLAAGTSGQALSAGPTDSFTALTEANAGGRRVTGMYRIDTTPASATPSYTIGASVSWDMIVAALLGDPDPGVTYITATESERTGTTDPHTFNVTIDANAKGCVLLIGQGTSSTQHVPSSNTVTVGGVAMTYVTTATDTATEPGRVSAWFLGSGLPSAGVQSVSVDLASATTDDMHFVFIQLGGTTDLEVIDSDTMSDTNAANPSVTLQYGGRKAIAVGMLYSGTATVGTTTTPNANMTNVALFDIAAFGTTADRQTTPGTSDFTFSYTSSADDVALVALAVSEVQAASALSDPMGAFGFFGV